MSQKNDLEQKTKILRASIPVINRYIFDRTVVLAAHDEKKIIEHGTGMLFRIDDEFIIITAAHVIKDHDPSTIQVITTDQPSNWRLDAAKGDHFGGDIHEALDVGFLRIKNPNSPLFSGKSFLSVNDLEFFPSDLETDLAILFGMPGEDREEPIPDVHSFSSFTYLTNFPSTVDWSAAQRNPIEMEVGYDEKVDDVFSQEQKRLPDPDGMSGGGVWRPHFKDSTIWTVENIRLLGILTENHDDKLLVKANRVENLYYLLDMHFKLPPLETLK